jgi:hypothetical protein
MVHVKRMHGAWVPDCMWVFSLQVMGLAGRVQAYALTSLTSKEEAAHVMAALTAAAAAPSGSKAAAGKAKGNSSSAGAAAAAAAAGGTAAGSEPMLLYVTPEKIVASKRLMAKLEKLHQVGLLSRLSLSVGRPGGDLLLFAVKARLVSMAVAVTLKTVIAISHAFLQAEEAIV